MSEHDELKRIANRIEEVWTRATGLKHDNEAMEYFDEEMRMALAEFRKIISGVQVESRVAAYLNGQQTTKPHADAIMKSIGGIWYWVCRRGETMIHRVTIPDWRPWPDNKLAGGVHWAVRRKRKADDADMVAAYVKQADIPHALDKRRVSLVVTLSGRQKKVDPLAYCKSLFDALVKCRMLIDDSQQFVEWGGIEFKRGERTATEIILEDCEEFHLPSVVVSGRFYGKEKQHGLFRKQFRRRVH